MVRLDYFLELEISAFGTLQSFHCIYVLKIMLEPVLLYIFPMFPSSYLGGDFTVKVTFLHVNLRPFGDS